MLGKEYVCRVGGVDVGVLGTKATCTYIVQYCRAVNYSASIVAQVAFG